MLPTSFCHWQGKSWLGQGIFGGFECWGNSGNEGWGWDWNWRVCIIDRKRINYRAH